MNIHVSLQIAFGRKGSRTDSTSKRPFACMSSIVHFQRTLTRQHALTNDAFIRIVFLRRAFELFDHVLQLDERLGQSKKNQQNRSNKPSTCADSLVRLRAIPFGIEPWMWTDLLRT